MACMDWSRLISDKRFGLEDYHDPNKSAVRTDFRRDFDRLVFSSPFRRLQNKTQVFPLPGSIFVHNRLTHSMEVSCVGRSMGADVAVELSRRYPELREAFDHIGDIVAAACLAHDLGNPPFGHSGEKAISTFFSEGNGTALEHLLTPRQWTDLTHFEGNANAFRLLTHQFRGRRQGGFAMTYSTLASIVKYPFDSSLATKNKFGFFDSECDDYAKVAAELGILRRESPDGTYSYARHPLVYIVEAADDICYEVMDFEDAHRLKILTTDEVIDAFLAFLPDERRARTEMIMRRVDDPNEQIAYLRSAVIGALTRCCAQTFLDHEQEILRGEMPGPLLRFIPERERAAYEHCNDISWRKIYCYSDVVDIEIAGNRIITFLLEKLLHAVLNPTLNYSRLLLAKFPGQYDTGAPTVYGKIQAVLDHLSGMTDVYALDLYRKLNGTNLRIEN